MCTLMLISGCSNSSAPLESVVSSEDSAQVGVSSNETGRSSLGNYPQEQTESSENAVSSSLNSVSSSENVERVSSNTVESSAEAQMSEGSSDTVLEEEILRGENVEREALPGTTLLSTEDWRDSTRFIYHPDSVHNYELLIETQDLAFLDTEPKKEEYVPAAMVFRGDTVRNILVRYKGSNGAWSPCGDHAKICNLSMKVKFNTDDHPDRLFYGLKKMQFHTMNHSQSHLSERFAYFAYREMGVAASRTAYARLVINGKLEGLFLVVEQIDGRFTRYHLNDDEGNVYKHYWPLIDDKMSTDEFFNENLKTNEEEADHTVVKAFESDLKAAGTKKNALTRFLKKWEMTDGIARQVVTATAVYDWDGPYMGAWDSGHNTYWAVLPKTEKIIMIPWDMDMPEYPDFMRGLITKYSLWNNSGKSGGYPGCPDGTTSRFTKAWFCFQEEYIAAFADLEDRVLSRRTEILSKWTEQIRPVMEEIAENFPTGNADTWPDQGGYPYKAQTIPVWEDAINTYHGILDGLEGAVEDMKKSIGL